MNELASVEASWRGGSGSPVALVHGIGGSWQNWQPLLPALQEHHDVLAVGLLGHHPSQPFEHGVRPSVGGLADGVERELDAAGFDTAHLVGNSLGGWVVLELAKRGRARSVVALSPGGGYRPGSLSSDFTAVSLTLQHRFVRRHLESLERLARRPRARVLLFAGMFSHPANISAREAATMLRSFGGAGSFEALLRGMKRDGALTELDGIDAPVLIGWGTRDFVIPARWFASRLREEIPGVEFRELPGLGHVPMVDDPPLIAGLILDWVDQHERAPVASPA